MRVCSGSLILAIFLSLVGVAGFTAKVNAQAAPIVATAATTPEQAQKTPAGKFIQDLGNEAVNIMRDKSLTQEQRNAKYRELLHAAFDLPAIGHFVIGRAWDTAAPEQQKEYMKLFEALVIKIYGDRLSFYSGESFKVSSVRQESDRDVVVSSQVTHAGGEALTPVDWRVRQENNKLAILDVVIDGISQSVTQRQEYASIIQRDGGKLDGLLALMRQRVQENTPVVP